MAASWSDSTSNAYKPYSVALEAHCTYNVYGCSDPTATNYQAVVPTAAGNQWAVNSDMCQYAGCNDTEAMNWNSQVSGPRSGPALPSCPGCQGPSRKPHRARIQRWGERGAVGRGAYGGWRLAARAHMC